MNKVIVCKFTEGDMNFVGRVFKDLDTAKKIFTNENKNYFSEFGAGSVEDMIDFGYVTFKETIIEGA